MNFSVVIYTLQPNEVYFKKYFRNMNQNSKSKVTTLVSVQDIQLSNN